MFRVLLRTMHLGGGPRGTARLCQTAVVPTAIQLYISIHSGIIGSDTYMHTDTRDIEKSGGSNGSGRAASSEWH